MTLADLEAAGAAHLAQDPRAVDDIVAGIKGEHLATLIYTSGTTGKPKGVRLLHECWAYCADAIEAHAAVGRRRRPVPVAADVALVRQGADGRPHRVGLGHRRRRPDPEARRQPRGRAADADGGGAADLREGLQQDRRGCEGRAARSSRRSSSGRSASAEPARKIRQRGRHAGWPARAPAPARRPPGVLDRSRRRSAGACSYFISGSAPLSREIAEFFHACGILDPRGLRPHRDERGVAFVNRPNQFAFGTRRPADARHRGQARAGGRRDPAQVARRDARLSQPARADRRGADARRLAAHRRHRRDRLGTASCKITDRKKDLIKTSGGKYIAPQSIEGKLKATARTSARSSSTATSATSSPRWSRSTRKRR